MFSILLFISFKIAEKVCVTIFTQAGAACVKIVGRNWLIVWDYAVSSIFQQNPDILFIVL